MLSKLTKIRHQPLKYFPHIDGLRAIAVISVVLHHISEELLPGGFIGVDVFFVISGYLITNIILKELEKQSFSFTGFYERRIRRIFPALFGVLTFTLIGSFFIFLPSDFYNMSKGLLGTLFFISNIVFWKELQAGYFAAMDSALNPLVHTWSLAVEEQFYVFFPILLIFLHKFSAKYLLLIFASLFFGSLFLAELFVTNKPVATFFLSPFRAYELLAGSILALNIIPQLKSKIFLNVLALGGVSLILYSSFFFNSNTLFPGISALVPVLGSAAVIYSGISGSPWILNLIKIRFLVFIGLISYSLYLWHWPIIVFYKYYFLNIHIDFLIGSLIFIICVVLSSFSYFVIEQPFRDRKFLTTKTIYTYALISIVSFAFIGSLGIYTSGFSNQHSNKVIVLDKFREPEHVYKHCDDKFNIEDLCYIGDLTSKEEVILFGDSHLMSWAPAFDKLLSENNKKGVLVMLSNCPPFMNIKNWSRRIGCPDRADIIQRLISDESITKEIILSGYWPAYYSNMDNLELVRESHIEGNKISYALEETIKYLNNEGMNITVIGPVPVYSKSVPFMLANEIRWNKELFDRSKTKQLTINKEFLTSIKKLDQNNLINFINPLDWICEYDCIVEESNIPLYFDSNHLNVYGSLKYKDNIAKELFK